LAVVAQRHRACPAEVRAFARRYVLCDPVECLGDVIIGAAFGVGPVRGEDIVRAPPEQKVEWLAEQLANLFAEHWVNVCERRHPAAEFEAASGILFRSPGRLHDAVHRNHGANDHFSHGSSPVPSLRRTTVAVHEIVNP